MMSRHRLTLNERIQPISDYNGGLGLSQRKLVEKYSFNQFYL